MFHVQRFNHTLAEKELQAQGSYTYLSHLFLVLALFFHICTAYDVLVRIGFNDELGCVNMSNWKKVNSRILGITSCMISQPSWTVLKILKNKGDYFFHTYCHFTISFEFHFLFVLYSLAFVSASSANE